MRPWIILFTLPAVILSLGLALLAINALMLWLTSRIVDDFTVGGFWSTIAGALIIWIVNATLKRLQRRPQADEARAGWERW
ncbi:MAG TPA: phage holin family protein [Solirubrobacteraceae bacterium]